MASERLPPTTANVTKLSENDISTYGIDYLLNNCIVSSEMRVLIDDAMYFARAIRIHLIAPDCPCPPLSHVMLQHYQWTIASILLAMVVSQWLRVVDVESYFPKAASKRLSLLRSDPTAPAPPSQILGVTGRRACELSNL